MKTALLLLIAGLFALSGCKSYYLNKYCKPETTRRDSTVLVMKVKDSIAVKDSMVITPASQTTIYLPSPCDSTGKLKKGIYTSSQGKNKTEVVVTDTGITVKSNCEETVSYWRELYRQSSNSVAHYKATEQKTVVEKQLSWFQQLKLKTGFFWWIGFGFIVGAMATLIFKSGKFLKLW